MIQQLFINGLIAGCIYALVSIGFVIIYRTIRFFHFAHGIVYTFGAYLAYTFLNYLGINSILSFFLPLSCQESLV